MEIITVNERTLEYCKKLELKDMFPKSLAYPNLDNDINFNINNTENIPQISIQKYTLSQNKQCLYTFSNPIKSITTFNNILCIGSGENLYVYNIEDPKKIDYISNFVIKDQTINTIELTSINFIMDGYEETINQVICAIGNSSPVIYLVDILGNIEISKNQLIGHRNEVYDLKFHPIKPEILLSCSKDCTIRIWNIVTSSQLVLFGGKESNLSDVLSIDWHLSGDRFVSGGIDNSVKIYIINDKIKNIIEEDRINIWNKKTLIKSKPYYSCDTIHGNYIDCVRFNGNFIISKSVDGVIKEWLPTIKDDGMYYFLINTYIFETSQYIIGIQFCFFQDENLLFVGNEKGKCFMFEINECQNSNNNDKFFFTNKPVSECQMVKDNILLRVCNYNEMNKCIFFGGENGSLYVTSIESL